MSSSRVGGRGSGRGGVVRVEVGGRGGQMCYHCATLTTQLTKVARAQH